MSTFDILPTPKKDEKIRLWGQENFRRIRDALVITNGYVTGTVEDVDSIEVTLALLEERLSALEQDRSGNRELGYASRTSNQTGVSTSVTDLTGLSVTVQIGTKPVMVIGLVKYDMGTFTEWVALQIYDVTGSAVVQETFNPVSYSGYRYGTATIMVRLTPAAGPRTYKLRAYVDAGSGDFTASSTAPSFIQVIELDTLEPAILDDFPTHFDTLDELQAAFATLDDVQDYEV